jgi:hypothetical protein
MALRAYTSPNAIIMPVAPVGAAAVPRPAGSRHGRPGVGCRSQSAHSMIPVRIGVVAGRGGIVHARHLPRQVSRIKAGPAPAAGRTCMARGRRLVGRPLRLMARRRRRGHAATRGRGSSYRGVPSPRAASLSGIRVRVSGCGHRSAAAGSHHGSSGVGGCLFLSGFRLGCPSASGGSKSRCQRAPLPVRCHRTRRTKYCRTILQASGHCQSSFIRTARTSSTNAACAAPSLRRAKSRFDLAQRPSWPQPCPRTCMHSHHDGIASCRRPVPTSPTYAPSQLARSRPAPPY